MLVEMFIKFNNRSIFFTSKELLNVGSKIIAGGNSYEITAINTNRLTSEYCYNAVSSKSFMWIMK